jgi:hypothetical protein
MSRSSAAPQLYSSGCFLASKLLVSEVFALEGPVDALERNAGLARPQGIDVDLVRLGFDDFEV